MTRLFAILSATVFLTSCRPTKTDNEVTQDKPTTVSVDSAVFAILPYDTSMHWIFKDCEQTDISAKEMAEIEIILKRFVDDYNPEQERQFQKINSEHPDYKPDKTNFIIDLKRYRRQYIAVTNKRGEKEVWINFFCDSWDKNWKEELIEVHDGGNCYYNLKVNLTNGVFYDLMVNGDA
jgi:hypothetical protein